MSLRVIKRRDHEIECDLCGESEVIEARGFKEAARLSRDMGWTAHKDEHGYWWDLCPDCEGKRP